MRPARTPAEPAPTLASQHVPRRDVYSTSPCKGKAPAVLLAAVRTGGERQVNGNQCHPLCIFLIEPRKVVALEKGSVMSRFSISAMMLLAIPAFAAAQHRGGAPMAPSRPAMVIPRAAPAPARGIVRAPSGISSASRVGVPVTRVRNSGRTFTGSPANFGANGNFGPNGNLGFNSNFGPNGVDFQNVPGLGFDYPHLAAISGNRGRFGGGFYGAFPFGYGYGGYPYGSPYPYDSPGIVDEGQPADTAPSDAQVSVADQNIPADAYDLPPMPRRPRAPRPANDPQAASAQAQSAPAPQPDVEQYVFVRRDGGVVFAVAYSWDKGTLRYVTPEGQRRSIGRDALDLNATQQFNEQRGLTFQAPA
jgi:hypothetical protein